MTKRQIWGRLWRVGLITSVVGFLLVGYEATFRARLGAPEDRVATALYTRPVSWGSERSRDPVPIGALRGSLAEYRVPVRLDEIPDRVIQAVLAVEDQRFYRHHGLDFRRIAGAVAANLKARGVTQGGSTITQQLAKNLFLSARRTPIRKLREAAMALALEDRYDKQTILEAYLNEIYLGQDGSRAIHGVAAAARYYFDDDLEDISLGEAALLAGMIRAPNYYTPIRHRDRARERRDLVLHLMVEQGRVSERKAERATRERIRSSAHPQQTVDARYFRDFVVSHASRETGDLPPRGAAVYTTLDASLQRAAERAVVQGLDGLRMKRAQAALVALDPRTGDVLAMVGGRDYGASQFNRASDALRQPGSAFKPIVALAALGRDGGGGPAFTLASVVEDQPLSLVTPAGRWEPSNYDREFQGSVTVREALEQSLNVPFARIGLSIGPERIVSTGKRLGLTSPLRPVPSIALGTSEVTPLELTRAYGVFATGGYLAEVRTVLGRSRGGGAGDLDKSGEPRLRRVADAAETYLVTSALEGVVARGTGRGMEGMAGRRGGLAGKSGTSDDWRDAWFVAYTPTLVVGVWVGYDDGESLRLTGSRAALPIVARFLRDAFRVKGPEPFPVPDGVEIKRVGRSDLGWSGWQCYGEREVFLEGTAPDNECRSFGIPDSWVSLLRERGSDLEEFFDGHADELGELFEDRAEEFVERLVEALNRRARQLARSR
jgi:penicillin-binding protein 1B